MQQSRTILGVAISIDPPPPTEGDAWPSPLYQLTLDVAAARRPDDIFRAALSCLEQSLHIRRASVLTFDRDGVMRFRAWQGLSDAYRAAVEGHSPWTPDTTDAEPVIIPDAALDPSLDSLRPALDSEGIRALAFVPLALGPRLLGKFMLYYDEPHTFTEFEILTARTVAAHVAFALDQHTHREGERVLRHVLDMLGVALYSTDAEGRITYYNQEAASLWGRHPEIGVDLWCGAWRLYAADGTPTAHADCPMAETLRTGVPVRGYELIAERPDGARVHVVPYPTPIVDSSGVVVGGVNVLVDITPRKKAELALAEQERVLIEALAEKAQLLTARDETITLYEAVQSQLASLIEASSALIGPEQGERAVSSILEIAAGLLSADAYAMWVFAAERDQWEIVLSRGLSDQYVAESTIRNYDGLRRLEEAMIIEDVYAEPQLGALTDRYREEGIASILVAPLGVGDDTNGTLTFYYRTPHHFTDLEVRLGAALANLASASLTTARLFEKDERARAALHAANEELARAAATKDEFLSLVSHELMTPLTTIRGNAGILFRTKEAIDPENRALALGDIVTESERLHRIIENLLLLARAEQGEAPAEEPILVVRVVNRIVARHREHHPERPYDITETADPRPVYFAEPLLEQILENFITNAEKYSPPNKPITVEVERTELEVMIRVLDRGVGIDPAEAAHLFDRFYRSSATKSRAAGLGIGLAVCKRIVESQGGRVWVYPRPGGGSEFGFALPATPDADL